MLKIDTWLKAIVFMLKFLKGLNISKNKNSIFGCQSYIYEIFPFQSEYSKITKRIRIPRNKLVYVPKS